MVAAKNGHIVDIDVIRDTDIIRIEVMGVSGEVAESIVQTLKDVAPERQYDSLKMPIAFWVSSNRIER